MSEKLPDEKPPGNKPELEFLPGIKGVAFSGELYGDQIRNYYYHNWNQYLKAQYRNYLGT